MADQTAVRTALWRALHVQLDAPPHVLEDEIGLRLADPDGDWRGRPDMDAQGTRPFRASIVARARFSEDLVAEEAGRGVEQYVLLGAGLDTFAQRRPELASRLRMFEVDRPEPQEWKAPAPRRARLRAPGVASLRACRLRGRRVLARAARGRGLRAHEGRRRRLDRRERVPTREANRETLRQAAGLAKGSTFAMSFLLPLERADASARPGLEQSAKGARASGTPFISFFEPAELVKLAHEAGFREVRHVSAADLTQRYFADRTDALCPPKNGEELLVAMT